jgi:predicted O-methyltransferase YrrM
VLKQVIHRNPRLNELRRTVRFVQRIPPWDYLNGKARAAISLRPYTYLSYDRLASLYDLARAAPEGAIVECGVWRGGSSAMMLLADPSREAWLFDSWEGLPEPGPRDVAPGGKRREKGANYAEQGTVERLLFKELGRSRDRVHLVRGWFEETLPATRAQIGPIALLHLDGDWYESTKVALEHLYDLVLPGGHVVADDYFHWRGCKEAIDEFLTEPVEMTRVDVAVHWIKR